MGDLNGDGEIDVVTGNDNASTVSVLLGNGDGSLGPNTDFPTSNRPFHMAIGDLNSDGRPDLAVATLSGSVSVLLGNGDGTFGVKTDYALGTPATSVAIGDLNRDETPDLAVAHSSYVAVLLGDVVGWRPLAGTPRSGLERHQGWRPGAGGNLLCALPG